MYLVFVYVIILAHVQPSEEIDCFVGFTNHVQVAGGYDFCSTRLHRLTNELYYKGHNGKTQYFDRDIFDITVNNCFTDDILGTTEDIRCYCQTSACNGILSSQEFIEMVFSSREDSVLTFNGSIELFLESYAKQPSVEKKDAYSSDI